MESGVSFFLRGGARWSAAAVLAAFAAWSPPAAAQLLATDVAGVKLGATAAEVEAVLRAHDARFKFIKVFWQGPDGKATTAVAAIKAAVPTGPGDISALDFKRPDGIAVYFGLSHGRAQAIYRQVADPRGIPQEATLQGVIQKYGADLGSYPGIYVRNTDASGKATGSCGASNFGWGGPPGGADLPCGKALRVQFDPKAPGVAAGLQLWLLDHQLVFADLKVQQSQRQVAGREAARRSQDAIRGNKPTL